MTSLVQIYHHILFSNDLSVHGVMVYCLCTSQTIIMIRQFHTR